MKDQVKTFSGSKRDQHHKNNDSKHYHKVLGDI